EHITHHHSSFFIINAALSIFPHPFHHHHLSFIFLNSLFSHILLLSSFCIVCICACVCVCVFIFCLHVHSLSYPLNQIVVTFSSPACVRSDSFMILFLHFLHFIAHFLLLFCSFLCFHTHTRALL